MKTLQRVYETVLYAKDLPAAADFYTRVMGFELLSQTELMLVLGIGENYLLVFNPEKSSASGRLVPSHGCEGQGHVAFTVEAAELQAWREHFTEQGVAIEREVEWDNGQRGISIYVRDPAENSVELAPPVLWSYLRNNS